MTIEQAGQIYYINKEIKRLQLELAELEAGRTYYKPVVMSDMPKGGGEYRNITDDYLEKKVRIQDMLDYSLERLFVARQQFEEFLQTVDDAEMRLILRLRCINNMTWGEIGDEIGFEQSTVSKKFYRFFKNSKKSD